MDTAENEDEGWGSENNDKSDDEDLMMLDEEEEWNGIKSDDDNPISEFFDDFDSFIMGVAAIKKKSREGWIEKMTVIEEKARKKAEKAE